MKQIMVSIFILCSCIYCLAQTPANTTTRDGSSYDIATNSTLGIHNYGKKAQLAYDEIDGSPYYNDEFLLASAVLANGLRQDSILLKYDLATHTFLAKSDDETPFSIDSRSVAEYHFTKNGIDVLFKRVNPKFPTIFYEIIYEDERLTLYKSEHAKIIKGEELGISRTNDRFSKEVKYYVKNNKGIHRVILKKKKLWKFFSADQQKRLDSYLKEHKVKLKRDEDFKLLFSSLKSE